MPIAFNGTVNNSPTIRAGFIGCGSHSFRNIYPTFQFAPVDLVAVCDLDMNKAQAFARQFAAAAAYDNHNEMLEKEQLDAVFVVVGYDQQGRPMYPRIATDVLHAGCHCWIEKPPAATCDELDSLDELSRRTDKQVMVGLKKMFFPANVKARELAYGPSFEGIGQILLQYPQAVPTTEEFTRYNEGEKIPVVVGFLDHLCHPASLMVYLMGMPDTLFYQRAIGAGGCAVFTFANGAIVTMALTAGTATNGGMERTTIISAGKGGHITIDNNHRVTLHRTPPNLPYGASPSYYTGQPGEVSSAWEPEFSLGQLYNKGLFLLGYYGEVNEFAKSILENRPPSNGTLEQARQVTRIFEAFAQGPGKVIPLS